MSDSIGILSKAAFKKDAGLSPASTYPVTPGATDMSAGHQVPFTSESIALALERSRDPSLIGSGGATPSDIIGEKAAGSLEARLRYRGLERLMMIAMGFEQPDDSPANLGTGTAYAHLFELDDHLMTEAWAAGERDAGAWANDRKVRRGQLGFYRQPNDIVWQSVMVNKMTLSAQPSEVKMAFDLIGYDKVGPGSYNHANWTLPTGSIAQALFTQMTFKLGLRAGGAGSLSTIGVSNLELALDNKLKGDDQDTDSGANIIEPCRSDMRDVTLKVEFPRYNSSWEALLTLMESNTEMSAMIEFTGPQISGSYYYKWQFFLPSLWLTKAVNPIDGPGPVKMSWEFVAARPNGTDIFESGYYNSIRLIKDSELRVMCINANDSSNYLTEV